MGRTHARNILDGKVPRLRVTALADASPAALAAFPGLPHFATHGELLASGLVDAVLIATPHYSHTSVGIAALQAGVHVLVEKPISVHRADAERLLAAHRKPGQIFAAMFNQRTDPIYRKLRDLVRNGAYRNAWSALLDGQGRLALTAEAGLGQVFAPAAEAMRGGAIPRAFPKRSGSSWIMSCA